MLSEETHLKELSVRWGPTTAPSFLCNINSANPSPGTVNHQCGPARLVRRRAPAVPSLFRLPFWLGCGGRLVPGSIPGWLQLGSHGFPPVNVIIPSHCLYLYTTAPQYFSDWRRRRLPLARILPPPELKLRGGLVLSKGEAAASPFALCCVHQKRFWCARAQQRSTPNALLKAPSFN